jgi:hypothetical protein
MHATNGASTVPSETAIGVTAGCTAESSVLFSPYCRLVAQAPLCTHGDEASACTIFWVGWHCCSSSRAAA